MPHVEVDLEKISKEMNEPVKRVSKHELILKSLTSEIRGFCEEYDLKLSNQAIEAKAYRMWKAYDRAIKGALNENK